MIARRYWRWLRRACAVLGLMWLPAPGGMAQDSSYCWPLDLPRELSSSFGEYRPGRFHMGVDLRTGGVTGKTVYAAADGRVSRVLCSPWGYGRAVYLQTNDGHTVVYGHLEGYFDDLAAYVRQEQHARKSYTLDLTPPADRFPVKRGQVLARTGDTGIGPAHLHYEIRDAQERPINPRLLDIAWSDDTPPMIDRIALYPNGPDAFVNGAPDVAVAAVVRKENGEYAADPVTASGRIGVGVAVVDRTAAGNVMGVHRLGLRDGGKSVFEVRLDRLSYDTHRDEVVCYDPYHHDKGDFELLWRWPDNRTEGYQILSDDGWWAVPANPCLLQVEAVDFMGNTTRLTIPVTPAAAPAPAQAVARDAPPAAKQDGSVRMDYAADHLIMTAHFSTDEALAPLLLVNDAPVPSEKGFFRTDAKTYAARWWPGKDGPATLAARHPRLPMHAEKMEICRRGAARTLSVDGLELRVPAEAPYGWLFLTFPTAQKPPATPLRATGPVWNLAPVEAPLARDVEISAPLPEGAGAHAALYRAAGDGWSWLKTTRQGNRLTATTGALGVFRVLEDDRPPKIQELNPGDQTPIESRRPVVRATVEDQGSGIAAWELTCDGQWLLSAYDPEANQITWLRDEDLPSGQHDLRLTVTDRAGNQAERRRAVLIPAAKK